ncbi:MAG: GAF domain-containing protein [Bacteroidetes bacterium]|nr:GAF domain-containing protein [Bacteroidota bacterium]
MEAAQKKGRYERIMTQLQGLLTKPGDPIARMATIAAVLSHKFDYFFWCGFYRVNQDELIAGPYQGPVACQVLKDGGVCWAAVNLRKTVVVPDVHQFPGHIACDSRSNSEIVIPVFDKDSQLVAVLDVDSTSFNSFDDIDRHHLEMIASMVFANQ